MKESGIKVYCVLGIDDCTPIKVQKLVDCILHNENEVQASLFNVKDLEPYRKVLIQYNIDYGIIIVHSRGASLKDIIEYMVSTATRTKEAVHKCEG